VITPAYVPEPIGRSGARGVVGEAGDAARAYRHHMTPTHVIALTVGGEARLDSEVAPLRVGLLSSSAQIALTVCTRMACSGPSRRASNVVVSAFVYVIAYQCARPW
jgi:hypothetical protein